MSVPPIDAMFRPEDDDAAYAELRALAVQLKDAIAAQPIKALLGYLYGHLLMGSLRRDDAPRMSRRPLAVIASV